MRFNILLLIIGIAILVVGINLSSLLTTPWIIVGTSTAIFGGTLTGINAYFLASKKKSECQNNHRISSSTKEDAR